MQPENIVNSIKHVDPRIHIFAVKVENLPSDIEMQRYLLELPKDEKRRIENFCNAEDRYRAIIGAKLLRWGLHSFCLGDLSGKINRNKYGRPYLDSSLLWKGDFNLSHSGNWVVLAIANIGKVGIDVEEIRDMDPSILGELLTLNEREILYQKPKEHRVRLFYEMWTMKEALYKTGINPDRSLEEIDISKYFNSFTDGMETLFFQVYSLDNEYPVTVCWEYNCFPVKINIIDLDKLS